ncbi:NAD-binding protein [Oscillospiraceae bacterium PP1C4]
MLFNRPADVIIVGSGLLGASLAGTLCIQGYHVIIIDLNGDSFRKLPESFNGFEVIGNGTDIDLLERAGINNAYMVIAATDSDNTNSLIAQIASRIYDVNRVFVSFNDAEKENLIDGFNIEVICPFKLSIHEFERLNSLELREATRG